MSSDDVFGNLGGLEGATTQAPAVATTAKVEVVGANGVGPVAKDFEISMPDGMAEALDGVGVVIADIGVRVSKVPIDKYLKI